MDTNQTDNKKGFSLATKIYLFVGLAVFIVAFIVAIFAHFINANRIDNYFKGLTADTARNFATMVDAEYLARLKETAASEEFQKLRDTAEEEDNEQLIEDYLRDKGLWDGYVENRDKLNNYLHNMKDVKYLYVIAWGDKNADHDMYLLDDDDNPIYETGYYEEREESFLGMDGSVEVEPTISNGDWGWLCSAFSPVYSKDGQLICDVGCDVGMDDIMHERRMNLMYIIAIALGFTVVILMATMFLIRNTIVKPLNLITKEMKKFSPSADHDYEKSGVMNLNINSKDEIEDIHDEIRSMQIRILDYLDDITTIQKEKEKVEDDIQRKEEELGQISKEAYRDSLTSVGSKTAYIKEVEELKKTIKEGNAEFAIVMVDVNCLKTINDVYGHATGDAYLKGCCRIVCDVYKHSPVYRIGGDEFVVILTGDDYNERQKKLQTIRALFEESFNNTDHEPWLRYSAAIGMAEYASDDSTFELVFKRADNAMYKAKRQFKTDHNISESSR